MPSTKPSVPAQAVIVHATEGAIFRAFGDTLTVKLAGTTTGGSFMLATNVTPPGGGPPPHLHRNEDEVFVVLEGRVAFFVNDRWTEVAPGGVAYLPRNVPHTFRNVGDAPSRTLVITVPSGFEDFFARSAELFAGGRSPDMNQIVRVSKEFGIEFAPTENRESTSVVGA